MNAVKKTRSELKRGAIIEAAKSAFQEFGVQGTSMDKLAELAQVSKRTVYNHFATKEELVVYLVSDLWMKSLVQIDLEYLKDTPLQLQLSELLRAEIDLICTSEYLELARVAFGHYFYHPETLEKQLAALNVQETALHRWLKAAVKDGGLRAMDTDLAVSQLHNLIKGSCFWPQLLKIKPILSADEKQTLADETAALFLSHYQEAK